MQATSETIQKSDLRVFIVGKVTTCSDCGEEQWKGDLITLTSEPERKAHCMTCSDLDHLVYLHAGSTALTRRAKANSTLYAIVLKWSKTRKRNERQGMLVEEEALERAEAQCLEDADARELKRQRAAVRAEGLDASYVDAFASRIRARYPRCPDAREREIAEHACRKYSGRVGRTAAAKEFDEHMIDLAVLAHVRHRETQYDALLSSGRDRVLSRQIVQKEIDRVLDSWRG